MNYQDIEKFVGEFEKRHDTDKLAQNMEDKLISPDLKAKSGDGKRNIQGGGNKTENEKMKMEPSLFITSSNGRFFGRNTSRRTKRELI